jgi:branched-chain amino acid transport system substrate-binding protein
MVRSFFLAAVVAAFGVSATDAAIAQDTVKIGIIMPLTGVLSPIGKQVIAAAKLYVAQHTRRLPARRLS